MSAISAEIKSLDEINYSSKIKWFLLSIACFFLFFMSFISFYPIGDKIKEQIKTHLANVPGCRPDFEQIRVEWFLPKIVISDLVVPSACLNKVGDPLKFRHLTLNFNLLSFAPFGPLFKLSTDLSGQPLEVYYAIGFGGQLIRLDQQKLHLGRLGPLLSDSFKMQGDVILDAKIIMDQATLKDVKVYARSRNFVIPPQSIQGFTLNFLKVNDFSLKANQEEGTERLMIEEMILGDANSPVRAKFQGPIQINQKVLSFSSVNIKGEVFFSESFKQENPWIDLITGPYSQKDGFYQVKLGGTLGQLQPGPL